MILAASLATALVVGYAVVLCALAERDHRRRRRFMGLPDQPSDFSLYVRGINRQRIRTEARLGISAKPLQHRRGE